MSKELEERLRGPMGMYAVKEAADTLERQREALEEQQQELTELYRQIHELRNPALQETGSDT